MKIDNNELTNGNIKQPIGLTILGGGSVYLILIILTSMVPFPSWSYFCLSGIFGMLGFFCHVYIRVKPSLYARFFLIIAISGISLLMAWRSFSHLFPQTTHLGIAGLTLITVFAHTLPMWNSRLAKQIRVELYDPKTKVGRILYGLSLFVLMFVPIINGVVLRGNSKSFVFIVLLLASLVVAITMPFAHRAPSSPWERDITTKKHE